MLTPAQAAFLAGLPQRPTGVQPVPQARRRRLSRQRDVLGGWRPPASLTAAQVARGARASGWRFARVHRRHFSRRTSSRWCWRRRPNRARRASRRRSTPGCRTTSSASSAAIAGSLERHGAANVAVVVLDNARGEWLAWEGSGDYFDAEHGGAINGPLTPRQPGSALKPFTYALAFEEGFTPASVLPDVPSHFPTAEAGVALQPAQLRRPVSRSAAGAARRWPDPRTCRRSRSRRSSACPTLLRFLTRAGLSTFDRTPSYYGLGLTLGNAEVRLDELVAAYAAFARGGEWHRADLICARRRTARSGVRSCRRARRSGSPTSCRMPRRASTSSAAAAASSFRSRSR